MSAAVRRRCLDQSPLPGGFHAATQVAPGKRSGGAERLWPAPWLLPCRAAGRYRRLRVRWVTPLGLFTAWIWKRSSSPSSPSQSRSPPAQHDGHHDKVRVIDQAGGQELAEQRPGCRTAGHLPTICPHPCSGQGPWGGPNLPRPHDLSAHTPRGPRTGESVIDAGAAAGLALHGAEHTGREQPLVQPGSPMPQRGIGALPRAGAEPIQRHRKAMHPHPDHDDLLTRPPPATRTSCPIPPPVKTIRRAQSHRQRQAAEHQTPRITGRPCSRCVTDPGLR